MLGNCCHQSHFIVQSLTLSILVTASQTTVHRPSSCKVAFSLQVRPDPRAWDINASCCEKLLQTAIGVGCHKIWRRWWGNGGHDNHSELNRRLLERGQSVAWFKFPESVPSIRINCNNPRCRATPTHTGQLTEHKYLKCYRSLLYG